MKKILCFLLVMTLLLAGCQAVTPNEPQDPGENPTVNVHEIFTDPTAKTIDIRSLSELETLRTMATSKDTEAVQTYLLSLGGGSVTQTDLVNFLKLLDALPKLDILDGEISWISLMVTENAVAFYTTVKAGNGDWVRTEYILSVTDIDAELAEIRNSEDAASLLATPVTAADGRLKLYTENVHTSEDKPGSTTTWRMSVDGIYGFLVYHSETAAAVDAASLFRDAVVTAELPNS